MATPNTRSSPAVLKAVLLCAKKIEAKTGLNATTTFTEAIRADTNAELIELIHTTAAHEKEDYGVMEFRRTKGRPMGECITNSFLEEMKTGNKRVWGYMTLGAKGGAFQCVVHHFNQDKETGEYYDSQDLPLGACDFALVSVDSREFTDHLQASLYDYYYFQTQGRVFRFRRQFGRVNEADAWELEMEMKTLENGDIAGRFL